MAAPALVAAALLLFFAIRLVGVDVWRVEGQSMWPTLNPGQLVLINRLAYGLRTPWGYLLHWRSPRAGDMLVFRSPLHGELAVKWCAAGPGDRVSAALRLPEGRVPEGSYVVLGTRPDSIDSRTFGPIPFYAVVGKVVAF